MKPGALHPVAETEFAEAADFYLARNPQLAREFTGAVEDALRFIRQNSEAGTPVRGPLRSWLVRRFPYRIIYREEESRIYVLAVAHHRRRPSYWHRRK